MIGGWTAYMPAGVRVLKRGTLAQVHRRCNGVFDCELGGRPTSHALGIRTENSQLEENLSGQRDAWVAKFSEGWTPTVLTIIMRVQYTPERP